MTGAEIRARAQERAARLRRREPSDCPSGDPWFWPVVDPDRFASWSAYVERIHSAIVRTRQHCGFDTPATLGDHLYDRRTA